MNDWRKAKPSSGLNAEQESNLKSFLSGLKDLMDSHNVSFDDGDGEWVMSFNGEANERGFAWSQTLDEIHGEFQRNER